MICGANWSAIKKTVIQKIGVVTAGGPLIVSSNCWLSNKNHLLCEFTSQNPQPTPPPLLDGTQSVPLAELTRLSSAIKPSADLFVVEPIRRLNG